MNFLKERKRKKQLSEMKARRRAEDDLLSPALRLQFDSIITELANAPADHLDAALLKARKDCESLPLPRRGRMYALLDLIIVVGVVAFGLRGLFFQPFRIPTGSMQPTLFGVHHQQFPGNANPGFGKIPGFLHNLIYGCTSAELKNGNVPLSVFNLEKVSGRIFDGTLRTGDSGRYLLPGNERQVLDYSKLSSKSDFAPGETISEGVVSLGDHLFVERVSMYLKPPARGDIIVFNTEGLQVDGIPVATSGGYYYIKRLAALPGDTVKIKDDQLYLRPAGAKEFSRIQDIAGAFAKVYSGKGGYHGHLNGMGSLLFAYGGEYTVPEDHYLMLGDNSKFSMDSRYFGAVPRKNLIGRAWFVFYPFSRRVGWVDRQEPLDEATGEAGAATFPVMSRQ